LAGAFASVLAGFGSASSYAIDGSSEKVKDFCYLTASALEMRAMTAKES